MCDIVIIGIFLVIVLMLYATWRILINYAENAPYGDDDGKIIEQESKSTRITEELRKRAPDIDEGAA